MFPTSFMGEVQGRAGAKLIGDVMGLKRVAMIHAQQRLREVARERVQGEGGRFRHRDHGRVPVLDQGSEFGPIVSKVKADNPDAIYASGYFFTAGPLVRQIGAAGIAAPVIGQEGYDSQKFIEIAGRTPKG